MIRSSVNYLSNDIYYTFAGYIVLETFKENRYLLTVIIQGMVVSLYTKRYPTFYVIFIFPPKNTVHGLRLIINSQINVPRQFCTIDIVLLDINTFNKATFKYQYLL